MAAWRDGVASHGEVGAIDPSLPSQWAGRARARVTLEGGGAQMQVTMSMMRKEFITGMMDCDSAEMICGTQARGGGRQARAGVGGWVGRFATRMFWGRPRSDAGEESVRAGLAEARTSASRLGGEARVLATRALAPRPTLGTGHDDLTRPGAGRAG